MRVNLRDIAQAAAFDPKKAILDAIGDYDGIDVFHHQVLVGTYIRPDRTQGGVFLPDRKLDEDRFQGKCALVLKVGPTAFKDDGVTKFGDKRVEVGDWVFFRTSDGFEFFLGQAQSATGASVRLVEDIHIMGRIDDPSKIY